ncbi:MAG: hypothetical protein KGH54_01800 [Candidatus Micrarchaeota archaeon]|nr:hypothetical protein [Candidatus Micrarchaeota archaeon]
MQIVKEGRASIEVKEGIFYNPKMAGLRDLSVLFLNSMGLKGYSLLDTTSATGIRGIRYRLEAGAWKVTFLDINKKAYLNTKANIKRNKIRGMALDRSIQQFCNETEEHFDVIDLDPFGSAAPYVYDLLKAAKDGTVLMATGTDTAVLCGATPLACYKNYGAMPMHNELCHEAGIRILIGFIAKLAAQFNFGIEVKMAVSNLHYMRVFLVLRHGAKEAVESVREMGFAGACGSCRSVEYARGLVPRIDSECKNCRAQMQLFGPLWLGSIKDKKVLARMAKGAPAGIEMGMVRLVERINGELDLPFYYSVPKITRQLGIGSVSKRLVIAELGKKHAVSETHFDGDAIKTDAGILEIIEAVKTASRQ